MRPEANIPREQTLTKHLDWITTIIPFICIVTLYFLFMAFPSGSTSILESVRFFLGDQLGSYYLIIGLGALICSLYMTFSRYGKIKLGNLEKPQYSSFQWGSMMLTAGLAADILLYPLCEWMLYASKPHILNMGSQQDWTPTYPLFHWGPIPWSFYLILVVTFGLMVHVHRRSKQKYSEACRALLGKRVDDIWKRIIGLTAVFALLAGTVTTSSLAAPLLSTALSRVFGVAENNLLTIGILVIICIIYTMAMYFGMQDVAKLAASCVYLFFVLLAYLLFPDGETRYIVETGITAMGNMVQDFIGMAAWTDTLRTTSFSQTWTIFYWTYQIIWCVVTPFFIGTISKGRTIRQTVLGGYYFGLSRTFTSFIVLGNCSLELQMHEKLDLMAFYEQTDDLYQTIIIVFEAMPLVKVGLVLLVTTMITFYATSFDALTMVASSYSYKALGADKDPDKFVKLFWAIVLILLPVALVFAQGSMINLQTVSIIAAFPIGFIIVLIVQSFFKDARHYLDHKKHT